MYIICIFSVNRCDEVQNWRSSKPLTDSCSSVPKEDAVDRTYVSDPSISTKYPCDEGKRGFWRLNYRFNAFDEAWEKVKALYEADELKGIQCLLKYKNYTSLSSSSFIKCYCGPVDDLQLLNHMEKISLLNWDETRWKTRKVVSYIANTTSLPHFFAWPVTEINFVIRMCYFCSYI